MTTATWNWGAFFASIPEANAALLANAPLPPAPDLTLTGIGAALAGAQGEVNEAAALLAAHPGAVAALDIVLAAQGAWTAPIRKALASLPGGVAAAQKYLPEISTAIAMFQPAATGIQGDGHSTMWQTGADGA